MARIGFTNLSRTTNAVDFVLLSVFFAAGFWFTNFDQQLAQVGNGQDGHHGEDRQDGHRGQRLHLPLSFGEWL